MGVAAGQGFSGQQVPGAAPWLDSSGLLGEDLILMKLIWNWSINPNLSWGSNISFIELGILVLPSQWFPFHIKAFRKGSRPGERKIRTGKLERPVEFSLHMAGNLFLVVKALGSLALTQCLLQSATNTQTSVSLGSSFQFNFLFHSLTHFALSNSQVPPVVVIQLVKFSPQENLFTVLVSSDPRIKHQPRKINSRSPHWTCFKSRPLSCHRVDS